ncbi:MAG: ABC transporter ATP-binding protein, partial [Alphaproteobacteria bacterium]
EMSDGNVLVLEKVSHAYGRVKVIHEVDLTIAPGELMCLLGPSGSGKTTILRLAAGLEELREGRILINGQLVANDTVHLPPERRGVGMVFQENALFPHLTALGNVAFGLSHLRATKKRERALAVLEQVGMADYAECYPHILSGGQQQRVALARALAQRPRLLLLDEPFSRLDSQLRSQIREETLHVLIDSGTTTLIVTHDPEEAMYMADRIAVLAQGRIAQVGPPGELYCQPVNAFVTKFFSSINRLEGVVEGNSVASPFGPIAAAGIPDGTAVEVLMRPEAIHVNPICPAGGEGGEGREDGTSQARIITTRMLRRASFIHLCIGDFAGNHLHFHSRVPGQYMPKDGETVNVRLDRSRTFVFPIKRPK